MLKRLVWFLVLTVIVCGSGYGAQTFSPAFEGIRADGMGGAYTSVGEGYEGIFYNPAGLTKSKSGNLILPGLYIKGNQDLVNFALSRSPADITELLGRGPIRGVGKGIFLTGVIKPSWALNFYDVAIGSVICSGVDTPTGKPVGDLSIQNDLGAILSIAGKLPIPLPLLDFFYGVNIKYIYRQGWNSQLPNLQLNPVIPKHGFGIDAGVICKVLKFIDVGVMFKDIFAGVGSDTVQMNMAIGASTKLLNFITISMDLADLTMAQGDFLDKVKLGAEVNLLGFLKVRGGLSQKFPTLGAGITFLFLNIDYAFMGEKPVLSGQALTQNPIGNHAISCSLIF